MNLHNGAVLANIIVKFASYGVEIKKIASVVLYINCLSRGIIDSSHCLQIKSLLKMQRILNIRI